ADAFDRTLAVQADERRDHAGIEVLAGLGLDRGQAALGRPGLFVRTLRGEGVVHVGDRDDACGEGDLIARLAIRIAGAIPALVVLPRDRATRGEELRVTEHRLAVDAVLLHDVDLDD